jgi:hypothetical protein
MPVKFSHTIANASQFPVPTVLATPKFNLFDLALMQPSPPYMDELLFTKNGRGALGIAGQVLKDPEHNVILIPAYHCPALVEPFLSLGYKIGFYPVKNDLSVDLETLESMLDNEGATHIVVIRYFGFNQNVNAAIDLIASKNVHIIEDCAHALFSFVDSARATDRKVSASICSINKILPSLSGGALKLHKKILDKSNVELTSSLSSLNKPDWVSEAKAIAHLFGIPKWIDKCRGIKPNTVSTSVISNNADDDAKQEMRYFRSEDVNSGGFHNTKFILYKSKQLEIRARRREIFRHLLKNINNSKVGYALYNKLDKDDIPYVFPFVLYDEKHFYALRNKGIQILRWEELASSGCDVCTVYRSLLIQIPCHQQLNTEQLNKIIATINELE